MNKYPHLFEPIQIGTQTVRNRVFMPPISTNLANKGYVTDELVQHYGARAKGGVGLIVSEVVTVEPTYIYLPGDMSIHDDSFIPGWEKLCAEVHKYDTKILAQLFHPAYMAFPIPGTPQLIAPSHVGPYYAKSAPRPVTKEELKVLVVKKGDRAADKAVVLAEDVEDYVVTSNGKKLYYLSDKAVYCVNAKNGKGKKTVASDEVSSSLYINGKDVVYFIKDGDAYATKNGGKAKKVVSDATRLAYTANGIVYVHTEDDIFATAGAKKPTKVFSKD